VTSTTRPLSRRLTRTPIRAVGALEVGKHQDVEKFGAGSGAERVEALLESALEFVGSHGLRLRRPTIAACLYTCSTITGGQSDVIYPSRAASHRRPEPHHLR
jgi:hypothetical protein